MPRATLGGGSARCLNTDVSGRYKAVDAAGRRTVQRDSLNRRTTYTYDAASQQTAKLDARSVRISYLYDNAGRPIGRTYANDAPVTLVYNAASGQMLMRDSCRSSCGP